MCAPEIGAIACVICLAICMMILCETANCEWDSVLVVWCGVACCVCTWTHFGLASVDPKSLYLILNFISVGMTHDSGTASNDGSRQNQIHANKQTFPFRIVPLHLYCTRAQIESKRKWMKAEMYEANKTDETDDTGKLEFVFVYCHAHTHTQAIVFSLLEIQVCQAAK